MTLTKPSTQCEKVHEHLNALMGGEYTFDIKCSIFTTAYIEPLSQKEGGDGIRVNVLQLWLLLLLLESQFLEKKKNAGQNSCPSDCLMIRKVTLTMVMV